MDFIGAKDGEGGGDSWSYKTCKAAVKSSLPTNQLTEEADETLFNNIRHNPLHILHPFGLLPKQIDYCYSLRPRSHNVELTHNHDDRNFIDRMLFRNLCSLA